MAATFTNQPIEVALRIGDVDAALVRGADAATVERVERSLASGAQSAVMIRPTTQDAAGHALLASPDLEVEILLDDDTEGHTLSLHFPTAQDARDFQLKVIAAGVLAGTLVVAGVGITAAPTIHLGAAAPATVSSEQALRDFRAEEISVGSATVPSTTSFSKAHAVPAPADTGTGLSDFRAEEISLGAVPAPADTGTGLSDFRAEEISLGAVPAPADTGTGLSDFRAEEISLGAVPAPADTGTGLSDFRAEEISLGAVPAPADTGTGLSDFRAEEISLGAVPAPADTGYQDQRAGEREAGSSQVSTTTPERKGGK